MTADLHSVPVELLQREIKKIAALINRSAFGRTRSSLGDAMPAAGGGRDD
jgi:hypothetical protein